MIFYTIKVRCKTSYIKIRCGSSEMERDSMIAHGVGQFLKERMMETSDITTVHVCDKCGLFAQKVMDKDYYECNACNNHSEISEVAVPYAFKLLVQELMAVNVLPRIRT